MYRTVGHCMYCTVVTICTAQLVTICTAKWSLYVPPSGHYMYRQFNIQQLYVLPTHCIYVFCVDLRTNSDHFPIQHWTTHSRHQFPSVRLSLQHMLSAVVLCPDLFLQLFTTSSGHISIGQYETFFFFGGGGIHSCSLKLIRSSV